MTIESRKFQYRSPARKTAHIRIKQKGKLRNDQSPYSYTMFENAICVYIQKKRWVTEHGDSAWLQNLTARYSAFTGKKAEDLKIRQREERQYGKDRRMKEKKGKNSLARSLRFNLEFITAMAFVSCTFLVSCLPCFHRFWFNHPACSYQSIMLAV